MKELLPELPDLPVDLPELQPASFRIQRRLLEG